MYVCTGELSYYAVRTLLRTYLGYICARSTVSDVRYHPFPLETTPDDDKYQKTKKIKDVRVYHRGTLDTITLGRYAFLTTRKYHSRVELHPV